MSDCDGAPKALTPAVPRRVRVHRPPPPPSRTCGWTPPAVSTATARASSAAGAVWTHRHQLGNEVGAVGTAWGQWHHSDPPSMASTVRPRHRCVHRLRVASDSGAGGWPACATRRHAARRAGHDTYAVPPRRAAPRRRRPPPPRPALTAPRLRAAARPRRHCGAVCRQILKTKAASQPTDGARPKRTSRHPRRVHE